MSLTQQFGVITDLGCYDKDYYNVITTNGSLYYIDGKEQNILYTKNNGIMVLLHSSTLSLVPYRLKFKYASIYSVEGAMMENGTATVSKDGYYKNMVNGDRISSNKREDPVCPPRLQYINMVNGDQIPMNRKEYKYFIEATTNISITNKLENGN